FRWRHDLRLHLARRRRMIRNFSDHAANERTFLAWTRTGLAVIAFGFLVEKFELIMDTLAGATRDAATQKLLLARLAGPLGRYDGIALLLVGIGLIIIAGIRYARTSHLIDAPETRSISGIRAEMVLTVILTVLATGFCVFVVFTR